MKMIDAIEVLNQFVLQGKHVFRKADLRTLFHESDGALNQTLIRLVKAGILERAAHGIYVFRLSSHIGPITIEHIANNLRRGDIVFESLESALSQYGVISQILIDRITLMTTGRSGEYQTPYGTIEFTHTKQSAEDILPKLIQREGHPIPIASKELAYENLRHVGRNLDLVDQEALNG